VKDIVPELLEAIQKDFNIAFANDSIIKQTGKLISSGLATYADANAYAARTGEILANAFKKHILLDVLPEGRMYFNIAERVLGETLNKNHDLISDVAQQVQTILNDRAGIGIKSIKPELNKGRIKDLVDKISNEADFEKVSWLLDEPVVNFSQAVVEDSIKANAEFHYKSGLSAKIVRTPEAGACEWCREVAGTYDYPDVPEDVYRRHERCRCIVEYDPSEGKRQNVWSKRWT